MSILVSILYEDQRGPTREFGLHSLVVTCVEDALGLPRFSLKRRLGCVPKSGNSKLLRACREDVEQIAGHGVVAVFDDDRVRELLKLPSNATRQQVEEAILSECHAPQKLSIVLLEHNLESVLHAAVLCDPTLDVKQVDLALRKDRLNRDVILSRLAYDEAKRGVRDCILAKVPSLKFLVDLVCGRLTPRP